MRCNKCNGYLKPNDVFCTECNAVASIPANSRQVKPIVIRDVLSCPECGESNISPLMNRCPKCRTYFTATTWACNGCNRINLYATTHCAHCGLTMGAKTKPSEYHETKKNAEKKRKRVKPYKEVTDNILWYYKYLIYFGIFIYSIYCVVSGGLLMDSSPIAGFLFFICSVTALASRFYLAERSALGPKIYLVTRFVGMYCTLLGTDLTEIFSSSNIELLPREAKNVIQGGVGIGFLFAFVLASAIFSVEAKYFAKRENYFNKNT